MLDIGIRSAIACDDKDSAVMLARASKSLVRGSLDNHLLIANALSQWKGQLAGLAAMASDAFSLTGQNEGALTPKLFKRLCLAPYAESVVPLLISTSAFGLHYPILDRLTRRLRDLIETCSSEHCRVLQGFSHALERVAEKRSEPFMEPLFLFEDEGPHPDHRHVSSGDFQRNTTLQTSIVDRAWAGPEPKLPPPDALVEPLKLDVEGRKALEGTMRRLRKGSMNAEQDGCGLGGREERGVREL